ncbi:hypothetical protein ABT56_13225 [Photobacterium aquae]|uniref:Lipoprotein n=2 Tax=Photobacterium aquae TaxID=1195763 RepID=A0A0J1GZ77_9GAMM|nr:hypothetical protein ABT56_13225 [Photobacterium aquae]
MKMQILVAGAAAILLSGCVTQSSLIEEGNWYKLGFLNGKQGMHPTAMTVLEEKTEQTEGAQPLDYGQYQAGYQAGIEQYCTPEQLEQFGQEGKNNWGACEFRRDQKGLYMIYWQRGYDKWLSFKGPADF